MNMWPRTPKVVESTKSTKSPEIPPEDSIWYFSAGDPDHDAVIVVTAVLHGIKQILTRSLGGNSMSKSYRFDQLDKFYSTWTRLPMGSKHTCTQSIIHHTKIDPVERAEMRLEAAVYDYGHDSHGTLGTLHDAICDAIAPNSIHNYSYSSDVVNIRYTFLPIAHALLPIIRFKYGYPSAIIRSTKLDNGTYDIVYTLMPNLYESKM